VTRRTRRLLKVKALLDLLVELLDIDDIALMSEEVSRVQRLPALRRYERAVVESAKKEWVRRLKTLKGGAREW